MAVKHLLCCAAVAALALASCVYPFEPGIETSDDRIVVEGSISIGGVSTFSFSRVIPFSEDKAQDSYYMSTANIPITGYIEGEDGTRIEPYQTMGGGGGHLYDEVATKDSYMEGADTGTKLYFDTMFASPSQRYRVHFQNTKTGTEYESDWVDVCPKPVIDELRYILDRDRSELNVALSMHSDTDSHFRWYYDETWEYHADLWASHYLNYYEMFNAKGEYQPELAIHEFDSGVNTYYCWNTFNSPVIKIFSTSEQSDNRFTDLEFHRVSSSNRKLQILYKLTVHLEAISENAFLYWQNIENNTNNQGTIFSPVPSQMTGNIHCITDPSIEVIGYIGAAQAADAVMYYDNHVEKFYNGPDTDWKSIEIIELTDPYYFAHWYSRGYLPYTVIPPEMGSGGMLYQWAKANCVDCRRLGGTKEKPNDWPNDHR